VQHSVTTLLTQWRAGNNDAETALLNTVYPVIKAIAFKQLRQAGNFTLRPTELANDAFMQMRQQANLSVENSGHFYAIAARMIRYLIVDHIRERTAQKRGGNVEFIDLELAREQGSGDPLEKFDWLGLDTALGALEKIEPEHATLIELRYFMGMSIEQASETMSVSTATAGRMWRFARAFLAERLGAPSQAVPAAAP
jgi:RNA polymerase sigma factor (TIGR02999 family)